MFWYTCCFGPVSVLPYVEGRVIEKVRYISDLDYFKESTKIIYPRLRWFFPSIHKIKHTQFFIFTVYSLVTYHTASDFSIFCLVSNNFR